MPHLANTDLADSTVLDVMARGKHLLTRVEHGLTLHTHLQMEGAWHLYRPLARWRGGPPWQVRLVLETADWQAVGYRLPVVDLLPSRAEHRVVGHLGPDLLGPDWNEQEAIRRLTGDPDREIGPALLDQRNLAGIGNLYKTEVLFLRGITPWTRVREIDDPIGLIRLAQRLLAANKDRWQQSTTGDLRRGRDHWVFERAGAPCRRCGTTIATAEQGEDAWSRVCYWCPHCQRGPVRSGASAPPARTAGAAAPATRRTAETGGRRHRR